MRILAIDYGRARIGLALSDPTGMLAQGLSVIQRKSDRQAAEEIGRVAEEHVVEKVVVGLPLNMNGSEGDKAKHCRVFAELIQEITAKPVELFDERLTTVAAQRVLIDADLSRKRRKQVVDAMAAQLLLQNYLDRNRSSRTQD
jgi:putative Holliday junction resolvase